MATTIMAALAALIATGTGNAMRAAAKAKELNAGRQLISAYNLAFVDNGKYLPGYDRTVGEIEWPDGTAAHGPAASRYPYRIGPYLDYQLEQTVLVNEVANQINTEDTYSVSLSPAFGINYLFVGGDKASNGEISLPGEVATRATHGTNVLVFASAGRNYENQTTHGFNLLTPPQIYGPMWVAVPWSPDAPLGNYGNIHARHSGKAVCAFLDGSVRLLGVEDLRDMRLWSMRAAEKNDPNYRVTVAPMGGGRR